MPTGQERYGGAGGGKAPCPQATKLQCAGYCAGGPPTEVMEHCLSEGECTCDTCGAVMEEIGKKVREA